MRHYFYNPLIVNFFKACSQVPFPSHFILFPSNLSHALGLKVPPICSFRDCSYLFCDYLNIVSLTFKMMLSEFHLVSIVPFMAGRMYLLFLSQFWGRFPLFLYSFAQPTGYQNEGGGSPTHISSNHLISSKSLYYVSFPHASVSLSKYIYIMKHK